MSTHELTTTDTTGINLTTSGTDLAPFTITAAGYVHALSAVGVYSTIAAPTLVNDGKIRAGELNVGFTDGGEVINQGTIFATLYDSVFIEGGGTVVNSGAAATILGQVFIESGAGKVTNTGQINSSDFFGVALTDGGNVANDATGAVIAGSDTGVFINTLSGAVQNEGTIIGTVLDGVGLNAGGFVNNSGAAALISGGLEGVLISVAAGSVMNTGMITSSAGIGVDLAAGGTIDNTGSIGGAYVGAAVTTDYGVVSNSGQITGGTLAGIELTGGGAVTNSGNVFGGDIGVLIDGADTTLTNLGTITSGSIAVDLAGSVSNRLIIGAEGQFGGVIEAATLASNTLELQAGAGTLAGFGTEITGFTSLDFDYGGTWIVTGDEAGLEAATITGFAAADTLDISDLAPSDGQSLTLEAGGILAIPQSGGAALDLMFSGLAPDTLFHESADGSGGTDITTGAAPCFCAGTRIATPAGPVPVEYLRTGDLVFTRDAGPQPVIWTGTRRYEGRFIAGNHLALPVCIRRHALGHNIPTRDLFVSPDHAICLDNHLVHAWRLINGVSITQAPSVGAVDYFHVELAQHSIIFAEDCPTESFLDTGCRARFHNAASAPATVAQAACLPRLERGHALGRIQARLNARAGIQTAPPALGALRGAIDEAGPAMLRGWVQDETAPETAIDLIITAAGQPVARILANEYRPDLRAAGLGSGCHGFSLRLPADACGPFEVRRMIDGERLTPPVRKQASGRF